MAQIPPDPEGSWASCQSSDFGPRAPRLSVPMCEVGPRAPTSESGWWAFSELMWRPGRRELVGAVFLRFLSPTWLPQGFSSCPGVGCPPLWAVGFSWETLVPG